MNISTNWSKWGKRSLLPMGIRGQGKARADIVIWRSVEDKRAEKSPLIVVECKAETVTIQEEDYYQGYNYAAWPEPIFS